MTWTHWQVSTIQNWNRGSTPTSTVGSNQARCSCTWQRYLSLETNHRATEEIPVFYQSWRGCNHPTLNCHQVLHVFIREPPTSLYCDQMLTINHKYAPGVWSVTGMSWRIIRSWLIEYYSSMQFPWFVLWNSFEKRDSPIWYDWSEMLYNSSL